MQMRLRTLRPTLFALVTLLVVPAGVGAQEAHVVDEADLRRAVAHDTERAAADRAAVREVLERSDVRAVAERMGLDLEDVRSALPTLSDEEASRLAERARVVDDQLAAGQEAVTVSTTWIIIGLLVLIALILIL